MASNKYIEKFQVQLSLPERIVILFAFTCSVVVVVLYCFYQSRYFGSYPYDGPFQTLYSLRKIAVGELPGRDFYFFHGNGIPYVHYPIYILFGKSIFGAHLAETVTHAVCVLAPIYFVTSCYFGRYAAMLAIIAWLVLSSLSFFGMPVLTALSVFQPLSTFGIRTVAPVVVAFLVAELFSKAADQIQIRRLGFALVIVSPLAFLLGTEHGIYTIILLYAAIFIGAVHRFGFIQGTLSALGFIVISVASVVGFHLIAFGNLSAFSELQNLVNDQSWYFGTYPHLFTIELSEYLLSKHGQYAAYRVFALQTIILVTTFFIAVTKGWISQHQSIFISFLLAESLIGLTSNLGYVSVHYAAPLLRVDFLVFVFLALRLAGSMQRTENRAKGDQ